jgi:hypothetical protein
MFEEVFEIFTILILLLRSKKVIFNVSSKKYPEPGQEQEFVNSAPKSRKKYFQLHSTG